MNLTQNPPGSHLSEPVRTPTNPLEYEWFTVEQAVAFCADRGLSRTPKTLRKWAERSYNKEDADIIVRRSDTMWGYRWKIEKFSLLRKVDEELSLVAANQSEPVRTSAHEHTATDGVSVRKLQVNTSAPVRTGSDVFSQPDTKFAEEILVEPGAHQSEPVRTGSLDVRPGGKSLKVLEDELRERLRDKDAEISFLREQLGKSQAEVERRATSTDED